MSTFRWYSLVCRASGLFGVDNGFCLGLLTASADGAAPVDDGLGQGRKAWRMSSRISRRGTSHPSAHRPHLLQQGREQGDDAPVFVKSLISVLYPVGALVCSSGGDG